MVTVFGGLVVHRAADRALRAGAVTNADRSGRPVKWAICSSAGVLVVLAAIGLYGGFGELDDERIATPAREYHVWAWRRDEDLSFVDPRRVRVAVWAATIRLDGRAITVERRNNTIVYPRGAEIVGVVRLETEDVPDEAVVGRLAKEILDATRPFGPVEHQVDFDARLSERGFYRRLLEELRMRAGGARLSITALASWCFEDGWTERLPVDAMVPMMYRMGRDGEAIRRVLHAERAFPNPKCAGSVGYSSDEPLAPVDGVRRVFLFHPRPWTEERLAAMVRRVEAL